MTLPKIKQFVFTENGNSTVVVTRDAETPAECALFIKDWTIFGIVP